MKTVVGIDNGTQSTKVIFYDFESKSIVAEGKSSHELIVGEGGRREQKASWWIAALKDAFNQIPEAIKQTATAIGVSGQQHGFVPLNKEGTPLYNVKLWNDTETEEECRIITKAYGGVEKLIKEQGITILPGFTAPKVLWLKRHKPELYSQLAHILLPHDYLNYYLTGEIYTEQGDASGTAYFNIYKRQWSQDILKAIDPDTDLLNKLPRLISNEEVGGHLSEETALELGLPAGIPVSSGGGDNMMGAIGTAAVSEGILTVSLGTSGTIYSYRESPMVDTKERLSAFCSSTNGWLPLLCTMNCTVATEQVRDLLKKDVAQISELAATVPPGSDGVIFLPFFNGERTPNFPHGKGTLFGLNGQNLTEAHLLRSAMESAAFGLKLGLEAFQEYGLKPKAIHLIGGGANSPVWRQIFADIFEVPIELPVSSEAAALGAALQALWALTPSSPLTQLAKEHIQMDSTKTTLPKSEHFEAYRATYKQYCQYIEVVRPLYQ
ncbi:xylulokinase [Spirochaeta cellobiosiphila]|uniref:xylulokinase n=1 Tax=Spirochaeta cellobiosiphila TaxID=504483 RepID=UPI00042733A5|nr:xylulokinase [Spirochaeta cellobiosiphila]